MKQHSPEDLQRASDYLEFIIHMAEVEMRTLNKWPQPAFERNVHIDSILIRLRALIEFLSATDTTFDTDVIARHYLPGFALPEDERNWLAQQKKRIDTTLAHLTIVPMEKLISQVPLPYPELYPRVMRGLKQFFDQEPANVLDQTKERFTSAYALLEELK